MIIENIELLTDSASVPPSRKDTTVSGIGEVNPRLDKRGGKWFAITPDGYREVKLTRASFMPIAYYRRDDGTVIATGIPELDFTEITRNGLQTKKIHDLMLPVAEKQSCRG